MPPEVGGSSMQRLFSASEAGLYDTLTLRRRAFTESLPGAGALAVELRTE